MIDLHSHLAPGVDDGAADREQARAGAAALAAQGVRTVVATPHLDASLAARPAEFARYLARVDAAVQALREEAAAAAPGLRVERGHEVRLDHPAPDLSEPRLRLAGTRFALVEFAFFAVPPAAAWVLESVGRQGWVPVLAHPERYAGVDDALARAREWRSAGALLQVNAGSLLGRYGPEPRERAWALVGAGLADCLAGDWHARGRPPLAEARAALEAAGGGVQAVLLTEDNPARLLSDQAPLGVPALPRDRRSPWARLFRRGG
jgi:protein-tyrosine phosphatase